MVDFLDSVLPQECVHIVWTLLPPSGLAAVMRTSKAWAHSAAPFLYRDVKIDAAGSLQALLRTVQRRPALAASVRSLRLCQHAFDSPDDSQSLDGPVAALLRHLPALRGLHLEGYWTGLEALASDGRFSVPFPHLRHLSLGDWGHPLAHLVPIWALPNIETLRANVAATGTADQSISTAWPASPTLTTLILEYATLNDRDVGSLLKHSPALTTFRWDRWCDVTGEPSVQDCDELGQALHHVRQTVKEIDLRVQLYSTEAEEVEFLELEPVRGHLPPFRDFTSLRALRIPVATLLGWAHSESPEIGDLLPPSLQRLCLFEDLGIQFNYEYTEDVVLAKLERFFTSLLHRGQHELKQVEISPDMVWVEWDDAELQKIRDMAAKAGVEFIVDDSN